jgi:hypothetical protein
MRPSAAKAANPCLTLAARLKGAPFQNSAAATYAPGLHLGCEVALGVDMESHAALAGVRLPGPNTIAS